MNHLANPKTPRADIALGLPLFFTNNLESNFGESS